MRIESMHPRMKLPIIVIALGMMPQLAIGQDDKSLERRGGELLSAKCARCHAVARTGDSPHSAAPPFRTLSRKYPIEGLAESLAEGLSVGHPDMPEFVFEPDDIAAILAYLNSVQEH
jgi:cytochrome c